MACICENASKLSDHDGAMQLVCTQRVVSRQFEVLSEDAPRSKCGLSTERYDWT